MSLEPIRGGATSAAYAPLSNHDESSESPGASLPAPQNEYGPARGVTRSHAASQPAPNDKLSKESGSQGSSTTLRRSSYILFLVFGYTFLALFAWTVTCILVFRPITAKSYSSYGPFVGQGSLASKTHAVFLKNENWYSAARVVQAIVNTLTLPLTSTVCAAGAVVFAQQRGKEKKNLSLRQLMVLANAGWAGVPTYWHLTPGVHKKGWKRYGSPFLSFSILLTLMGGILGPLQQVFLSTRTIKTPTQASFIGSLHDLTDIDQDDNLQSDNFVVGFTRSAMAMAKFDEPVPQLWSGANLTAACNLTTYADESTAITDLCSDKEITFSDMAEMTFPYFAELPNGFNTGLISSYLPRINSTASLERASSSDFPTDCASKTGSFYAEQSSKPNQYAINDESNPFWQLQACMPDDMRQSPWRATGDKQGFSEELWLNLTYPASADAKRDNPSDLFPGIIQRYIKITITTSAGYFELPNYMNNQVAGPLLETSPIKNQSSRKHSLSHRAANDSTMGADTTQVEAVRNKGPLLTIAMALFGSSSFTAYPSTQQFGTINGTQNDCSGIVPFQNLLLGGWYNNARCWAGDQIDADYQVQKWLAAFEAHDIPSMNNVFTAAAFLANAAWLQMPEGWFDGQRMVWFDLGEDTEAPKISLAGIIIISLLLGLYLLGLIVMAFYAVLTPSWADNLDAWAMMRIGAEVGKDRIPLRVDNRTDAVRVLDEMPGWIGEIDEADATGRIQLGATGRMRGRRRYICYGEAAKLNYSGGRSGIALEPLSKARRISNS